jgi:hypothetical protein
VGAVAIIDVGGDPSFRGPWETLRKRALGPSNRCTTRLEIQSASPILLSGCLRQMYNPVQFTVRDLLVATAIAAFLCALSRMPGGTPDSIGIILRAYGVLVVIYFGRLRIQRACFSPRDTAAVFSLLVISMLPFVYWYLPLTAGWNRHAAAKWIGDPVGIFFVPCSSFIVFSARRERITVYVLRSIAELSIAVPIWHAVWSWIQVSFGWVDPLL